MKKLTTLSLNNEGSFELIPGFAVLSVDFYKISHRVQFQEGQTESSVAHLPRKHRDEEPVFDENISAFGVQAFAKDYLVDCWNNTFFNLDLDIVVNAYKQYIFETLGDKDPYVGHLVALHKLGYLPIRLRALTEGIRVKTGIPHWTIDSTNDDFAWLPGYLETPGLSSYWKIMTVANIGFDFRWLFEKYAKLTCDDNSFVPFQVHDFSARSHETIKGAGVNGMGHLMSFKGTDTCISIVAAKYFYPVNNDLIGTSVDATEHSTMSSNIKFIKRQLEKNGKWKKYKISDLQFDETHTNLERLAEIAYIAYLLETVYPKGIVSVVMDTYDYWYMIEYGLKVLKPIIMKRDGKLVVRPDSGKPEDIIFGKEELFTISKSELNENSFTNTKQEYISESYVSQMRRQGYRFIKREYDNVYYDLTKENIVKILNEEEYLQELKKLPFHKKGTLAALEELFGTTVNTKGYKELDQHIGLIYGDSITIDIARNILKGLKTRKFASNNIVVGLGSGYQKITRDSYGNAVKLTHAIIEDEEYEINKSPLTDPSKASPAGRLAVVIGTDGEPELLSGVTAEFQNSNSNILGVLLLDGKFQEEQVSNLDEIREISESYIYKRIEEMVA